MTNVTNVSCWRKALARLLIVWSLPLAAACEDPCDRCLDHETCVTEETIDCSGRLCTSEESFYCIPTYCTKDADCLTGDFLPCDRSYKGGKCITYCTKDFTCAKSSNSSCYRDQDCGTYGDLKYRRLCDLLTAPDEALKTSKAGTCYSKQCFKTSDCAAGWTCTPKNLCRRPCTKDGSYRCQPDDYSANYGDIVKLSVGGAREYCVDGFWTHLGTCSAKHPCSTKCGSNIGACCGGS